MHERDEEQRLLEQGGEEEERGAEEVDEAVLPQYDLNTTHGVVNRTFEFSSPFVLAKIVELGGDIITLYFASRHGLKYVAASGIISSFRNLVIIPSKVATYGVSIVGNRVRGGNPAMVGSLYRGALLYGGILSVVSVGLLCANKYINIYVLGQDPTHASDAAGFLYAFAPGVPAMLAMTVNYQGMYASGDPWSVVALTCLQTAILSATSGTALYNRSSFPGSLTNQWGASYSITYWLMLLATFLYLRCQRRYQPLELFADNFSWQHFAIVGKIGTTIGIQAFSETLSTVGIVFLAGLLGTEPLAAAEAALQYIWIVGVSAGMFGQASAVLNSEVIGEELATSTPAQHLTARKITGTNFVIGAVLPTLFTITTFVVGNRLGKLFLADSDLDLARTVGTLLKISACKELANTFRLGSIASLRTYKDNLYISLFVALNQTLIGTLAAWLAGVELDQSVEILFIANLAAVVFGTLAASGRWWWRTSHFRPGNDDNPVGEVEAPQAGACTPFLDMLCCYSKGERGNRLTRGFSWCNPDDN